MQPDGRYRGPFGPDSKKTRAEREQGLFQLACMEDGAKIIAAMWKGAIMILELLKHEYPNG
jgi:hypothetical protein